MSNHVDTPAVVMQVSRGVIVATVSIDLEEQVLARFCDDLLYRIRATECRWVFFDLSGADVLDSWEFMELRSIMQQCAIMGSESILVGLRPGVVSALIESGVNIEALNTAIDLDSAYLKMESARKNAEKVRAQASRSIRGRL